MQAGASIEANIGANATVVPMRTTINFDEDLLAEATKLAGPLDRSAVVRDGLKALIQRKAHAASSGSGAVNPD